MLNYIRDYIQIHTGKDIDDVISPFILLFV